MVDVDDESHEANKAPRRYVTTACNQCRESKVKCDALRPHCSQCRKRHRTCVYPEKNDKRKVSLRATVELLTARVNDLTNIIVQNGLQVPPMSLESQSSLESVLHTLELPLPPACKDITSTVSQASPTPNTRPPVAEAGHDPDAIGTMAVIENSQTTRALDIDRNDLVMPGLEMETQPQFFQADVDALVNGWRSGSSASEMDAPEWPSFALDPVIATNMAMTGDIDLFELQTLNPGESADLPTSFTFNRNNDAGPELSEDEADSDLVAQLSARFGSLQLAPDGQLRFFGAAANLHLLDYQMRSNGSANVRSVHEEGQRLLEHANVDKHVEASFENHLLDCYFKWHEPCLPLVNRAMFEAARQHFDCGGNDMGFCSGVLVNAMCAIGAAFEAKYHPTFITFPKPLAEFFAERAKVLLDIELDSPCVATMQGLILLSHHEASVNRDARGWLYSGMAMRLTFDLGLHVDCTLYVQQGKMSQGEAEARRTAFWGCYVVNHLYSFYLGRPFQVDVKEITVARPMDKMVPRTGSAWTSQRARDFRINETGRMDESSEHSDNLAAQLVFLCETVTPQAHMLYMYGQNAISHDELRELSHATTTKLFRWKATLPSDLQVDHHDASRPYLPQVLMLHMLYHYLQIMLHRPYTSRMLQPKPLKGPGHTHARAVCLDSASAISQLLQIYEAQHTFHHANAHIVHVIYSAALIMVFAMLSGSSFEAQDRDSFGGESETGTTTAYLSVCFRALDESSRMFERAKNVRENLFAIQSRWDRAKRKHKNAKRPDPHGSDDARKRRLTGHDRPMSQGAASVSSINLWQAYSNVQDHWSLR